MTTPSQQNWLAKLLGYDYEIQYKHKLDKNATDALSTQCEEGNLVGIRLMWTNLKKIHMAMLHHDTLSQNVQLLQARQTAIDAFNYVMDIFLLL